MRLLVCGDRHWSDKNYLYNILDYHLAVAAGADPIEYVIEGEATGADEMAGDWAQENGQRILTRLPWIETRPNNLTSQAVNAGQHRGFPALWHMYGHRAGPIRNKEMLDTGKPTLVLAFHNDFENSRGTKNMIGLISKAGIKYVIYAPDAIYKQKDFGFNL